MSDTVIKVEHLSKHYNLGTIGSGTLYRDFQSWWARVRGKDDPNTQLGTWDASQMDEANSFWALKDVSFEVKQGDVVGIIGRNGAGKSTLLKILSRVTGPTTGNIKIKGRVASLLEVGTGFHPELTGRENVYLNGTILGMRKAEIDKKFDEIVAFAEIEKFIDTPVKRYSSGMYVRLAFAVAAHLDPEILIVDEVLAVGDANFQKKCLGKMQDIGKEGRTVLFVSHNIHMIRELCEKGIYLLAGEVSVQGEIGMVIQKYLLSALKKGTNGYSDLTYHPGRPTDMNVLIKSIGLLNRLYQQNDDVKFTDIVTIGDEFSFEIEYNFGYHKIDYFMIVVNNSFGVRACTLDTRFDSNFESVAIGNGKIVCHVPQMILAPGQYTVGIACGTLIGNLTLDWIEDAMIFDVVDDNYFETGKTLLPGQGYFVQKSYWHFSNE